MDQATINFAVYEDGTEFMGMAKATLPDLTSITQTISGAGIAGNIEAVILGMYEAMTLGLSFRNTTNQVARLSEPRRHIIDLRAAQQDEDSVKGVIAVRQVKHVFVATPKSTKGGTIAPASPTDGSGEYAVSSWTTYIDGKKIQEIDQQNCKCFINGVDYYAAVRKALGK